MKQTALQALLKMLSAPKWDWMIYLPSVFLLRGERGSREIYSQEKDNLAQYQNISILL